MATFTVTTADDVVDSGDGALSLREAVAQANATAAADTIVFASTIEGQALLLTGGQLTLSQDITIDGDQNNDGTAVLLQSYEDPDAPTERHISVEGNSTEISLTDLVFTNGGGSGGNYGYGGGSILVAQGGLKVSNCDFVENTTYYGGGPGGAISMGYGTSLLVSSSTFTDNYSASRGGAIYLNSEVNATIRGSQFTENAAYGSGGAINSNGNLTIEDSLIAGNRAFNYGTGGGIRASGGSFTINRSTISSNDAYDGGGMKWPMPPISSW